jgi:hypothetical protein
MTNSKRVESIRYPKEMGDAATRAAHGDPKRRFISPEEMLQTPGDNAQPNPYRDAYATRSR